MEIEKQLIDIVGEDNFYTDSGTLSRHCKGYRYGKGEAKAVIKPHSLVQLWQVVKACVEADVIMIFQAANTGLTGGSTPYGDDYDRDVVLINTMQIKGIQLLDNGKQIVALPGATLFELGNVLEPVNRDTHSVIGSSSIGASIVGGICNNSGGALVHRGPAYTEMALYAQVNAAGELVLVNNLGIDLGDTNTPETLLAKLEQADYRDGDVKFPDVKASDDGYEAIVRDIDADTPARYNNDPRLLHSVSGSAGKLVVFAVRVDTFAKPKSEQTYYIGANDPAVLQKIRRHMLTNFTHLPAYGEYLHRSYFNTGERYGKDGYLLIRHLGTAKLPTFFALKNRIDGFFGKLKLLPNYPTDKCLQLLSRIFPKHLPKRMCAFRDRFEHHLIVKMTDGGESEAKAFLSQFFDTHAGDYFICTPEESEKAFLHRFVAAGAAKRYHLLKSAKFGDLIALDVALPRNAEQWFEQLPEDIDALVEEKFYCGHLMCHVMHHDYILKKGVDAEVFKQKLLDFYAEQRVENPAEHNVGHAYEAKPKLQAFYRELDPTNTFNAGIGKTSRNKHWRA